MFLFVLLMGVFAINVNAQEDETRGYIVKVGEKATDFTMNFIDGDSVKLSDLKGKVVMLQFTASWCGVCRKEMPFIESEIYQKYKENEKFALFAIDRDEPLEKIMELKEKTGITYPLAFDPDAEIFTKFANKKAGVTRNVIINEEGKIVFLTRLFDQEEFDALKAKIESLLTE